MKKLIVLLALFLLVSCSCKEHQTPVYDKSDRVLTTDVFDEVIEFTYKGHDYIWFRSLNGGYAGYDGGIVPDPNCRHPRCVRERKEKEQTYEEI